MAIFVLAGLVGDVARLGDRSNMSGRLLTQRAPSADGYIIYSDYMLHSGASFSSSLSKVQIISAVAAVVDDEVAAVFIDTVSRIRRGAVLYYSVRPTTVI